MTANTIVRLKITLDDVRPTILRRVELPFDISDARTRYRDLPNILDRRRVRE